MRRQHPDHRMDIPISLEIYQQLCGASINTGFVKEDWEIAAEAIDEWMRRHDPDALATQAHCGYQWKRVFLPDGTVLRTVFDGKNYHCVVEGGRIAFNGKEVSPSGFVNAVGGVRRNAWLCTWILFPDTKQWQLADALRAPRPRRPRAPARNLQPAPAATQTSGAPAPSMSSPAPATPVSVAAHSSVASCQQHPLNDHAPQSTAHGETLDQQPRAGIPLPPPLSVRGTDRRSGDDRIAVLLRQEVLPLLYRMCGGDAVPLPSV